jgi:hypothetical protein
MTLILYPYFDLDFYPNFDLDFYPNSGFGCGRLHGLQVQEHGPDLRHYQQGSCSGN